MGSGGGAKPTLIAIWAHKVAGITDASSKRRSTRAERKGRMEEPPRFLPARVGKSAFVRTHARGAREPSTQTSPPPFSVAGQIRTAYLSPHRSAKPPKQGLKLTDGKTNPPPPHAAPQAAPAETPPADK